MNSISSITKRACSEQTQEEIHYLKHAKQQYETQNGAIKFDCNSVVSIENDGAYVMCWVWIPYKDTI